LDDYQQSDDKGCNGHRDVLLVLPNVRDQRWRAVGAPIALVASGVTTRAERCIAL
jgi:hypothetical protein